MKIQEQQSSFPLMAEVADTIIPVLEFKKETAEALAANNITFLIASGIPEEMIPIMQLWKNSPQVLLSTAHSEEVDLYKSMSFVNMRILQKLLKQRGYDFSDVLVTYFDTVPLHASAKNPLRFGTKIGKDFDLFGLYGKGVTNQTILLQEQIAHLAQQFVTEIPGFANFLERQIDQDITNLLREITTVDTEGRLTHLTTHQRVAAKEEITKLLESRLKQVGTILASVGESDSGMTVAHLLMEYEKLLAGVMFTSSSGKKGYEEKFGYASKLYSENMTYRDLIKTSLAILLDVRGVTLIREAVSAGSGISLLYSTHGERQILTLNNDGAFVLTGPNGNKIISDEDALQVFLDPHAIPLSRMETLAIIAGGNMLHMGSEYGVRAHLVEVLGFSGRAKEAALASQIGKDKQQGNDGIVLSNGTYLSLTLAFVLLGANGVRKLIGRKAGKTAEPDMVTDVEARSFIAKSLLSQIEIP